jgi:hypothetical protein
MAINLTSAQYWFLICGPKGDFDNAFDDEAEVLAAWAQHREQILARYQGNGRRPWGFWAIDHPELRWRGYDRQRSTLCRAGLLGAQEKAELVVWWRQQYDRAWSEYDGEPGARRKHLRSVDVPANLVRQWDGERRPRGKAIRKFETACQPEPAA